MAASKTTVTLERPTSTEDGTLVLPRCDYPEQRKKYQQRYCAPRDMERNLEGVLKLMQRIPTYIQELHEQKRELGQQEKEPWIPLHTGNNPERELKLLQKMQAYITSLENSDFFQAFIDQAKSPEMLDRISKVLCSESSMPMVTYGIGNIESLEQKVGNDNPQWQLALAILMKRNLSWIGSIEVFDPVISLTESRVMEALGCCVLSLDEKCSRQASGPTLFFMPHCDLGLYKNLLKANWRVDLLNNIVLLGNSFEEYYQRLTDFIYIKLIETESQFKGAAQSHGYILASRLFTQEIIIDTQEEDDVKPFNEVSWHFFNLDPALKNCTSFMEFASKLLLQNCSSFMEFASELLPRTH